MPEFRDQSLAQQYMKEFLLPSLGEDEFAEIVAYACLSEYKQVTYPPPPPGVLAMMLPRISWVIRDEDLKASDTFWKALAAAGGANFFRGSITASAVVGLLSAAFSAYRAVTNFGIRLTVEQTQVLVALKKLEKPSTPDEIASTLKVSLEEVNKKSFQSQERTESRRLNNFRSSRRRRRPVGVCRGLTTTDRARPRRRTKPCS